MNLYIYLYYMLYQTYFSCCNFSRNTKRKIMMKNLNCCYWFCHRQNVIYFICIYWIWYIVWVEIIFWTKILLDPIQTTTTKIDKYPLYEPPEYSYDHTHALIHNNNNKKNDILFKCWNFMSSQNANFFNEKPNRSLHRRHIFFSLFFILSLFYYAFSLFYFISL